jgi:hypothetical protein
MRTLVENNPNATIAVVLGEDEGKVYQCSVPRCGKFFASQESIRGHFSQSLGAQLQQDWVAPRTRLIRRAMHQRVEDERIYRRIEQDAGSNFLNRK